MDGGVVVVNCGGESHRKEIDDEARDPKPLSCRHPDDWNPPKDLLSTLNPGPNPKPENSQTLNFPRP